ncbi:hypothetical protein BDB00DRAFT_801442 [Zychaea mexicana]|uniref:uncharacterized protein n=1 Tax=Zychaea mexicana TaxID=64656 RepID=UPI0022FEF4B9|nr:uncharacterized protein BDB00DRAFT_801442 [Zychaea mexicana]KAI9498174.1 hypothetical protein BDB00DRAFT_801442 [Zychaea mexicana]
MLSCSLCLSLALSRSLYTTLVFFFLCYTHDAFSLHYPPLSIAMLLLTILPATISYRGAWPQPQA